MLILGLVGMAWMLFYTNIPQNISTFMLDVSDNPIVILLLINQLLIVVGVFLDMTPAVLIFTPIFLPVAAGLGMSPLQFDLMIVLTLSIGLC